MQSMSATPRYAWRDAAGTVTSLMDPERFVVLRDGIHGFADTTDDRTLTATADRLAQRCTGTTAQPRELGFTIMIIGSSHADLLENRQHLIDMFAEPGTLSINLGDRTVSIACYAARGSPEIRDGISPSATSQKVGITLIAPDPCFYGDEITETIDTDTETLTVTNPGTRATPCTLILNDNAATNTTTGETMQAIAGQTVAGATVTVTEDGVTAAIGNTNVLGKFTYDSAFWMLAAGTTTMTGIEKVTFRPRWMGV